ncbi:site-specific DNA-methyltransferase [Candidatus Poribacteria bacterium]|nr:site-specific DNA-methyltransferase [Candidatus Poribacteria bacterium]MYH81122.1 site-specific DNA-methyltransferase [Candidatus Poribacteria bacterium]MYK92553.1 site-specific DNA-methyltransferase [Candidatus Poribacteria bacterium]
MNTPFANTLYYGDCLDIMAGFPDSYIDLICLDPPFNSNEKYNKVFKDSGLRIDPQIKAFDDVWLWDNTSAERVERVKNAVANPDDLVLDPFADCGTTIEAAKKNGRDVIGIDILPFALRLINRYRLAPNGITPLPIEGVPVDMDTARQFAKTVPFKFQDWTISLIDGLASNPQKVGDDGIDGFGMFLNTPDNMDRKAIIVQVTGASGSQKAKFDRLHANIRNENAAMGILITLDAQTAQRNWKHTLDPVRMGETTYAPIQCFSVEEYYRNNERWDRILTLPSLANPWTGKHMQQKILFEA